MAESRSQITVELWFLKQHIRHDLLWHTYLLEQGELSLMAMKTLEELTFLN